MNTDNITEGVKLIEQGIAKLNSGPLDYTMKCLLAARDLLLNRFAPFKVGDRVTLTKNLEISSGHSWYGFRHFLVPGEPATVESSDCNDDGKLRFFIVFDNETYIQNGEKKPVMSDSKHSYMFFEGDLVLLNKPITAQECIDNPAQECIHAGTFKALGDRVAKLEDHATLYIRNRQGFLLPIFPWRDDG